MSAKLSRKKFQLEVAAQVWLPLLTLIGGWIGSIVYFNSQLKKDYVQIAVEVLKSPERNLLREWAAELLAKNSSDVKITPEILAKLKSGEINIPNQEVSLELLSLLQREIEQTKRLQAFSMMGVTMPIQTHQELKQYLDKLAKSGTTEQQSAAKKMIETLDSKVEAAVE